MLGGELVAGGPALDDRAPVSPLRSGEEGAGIIAADMHALRLLPFAVAAVSLGVGCVKPYNIISQAAPDPFIGKTDFVVMPVDFTDMRIGEKTEAEYLSEKKDSSAESFQGDKDAINQNFQAELEKAAASVGLNVAAANGVVTTFLIQPHVRFIEPGFYAAIVSHPSKLEIVVTITDQHGTLLDKFEVEHETQSGMFNPASGQRLRSDADACGAYAAEYLADRTKPK